VYIKELMTMLKDEHIYEWGKNVICFNVVENVRHQVAGVQVLGHDMRRNAGFRATVRMADLNQKIGGR
jgi:hypothetical protein